MSAVDSTHDAERVARFVEDFAAAGKSASRERLRTESLADAERAYSLLLLEKGRISYEADLIEIRALLQRLQQG